MPGLSAVIITYNEEKYIGSCVESLQGVADEIVVVDSGSTDKTREICERLGCRVILHDFEGYIEQKNWAMARAKYDHILSLDGDELLSDELKKSILRVKEHWDRDGYYLNRRNRYYGKWLYHSGEYPDRKLRLADRRKASWNGINPHDNLILENGATKGFLKGDLLHYAHESYEEHLAKVRRFAAISARELYRRRGRSSWLRIMVSPLWRFMWNYFFRLGFLDGSNGLRVCYVNAYQSYLKHRHTRDPEILEKTGNENMQERVQESFPVSIS